MFGDSLFSIFTSFTDFVHFEKTKSMPVKFQIVRLFLVSSLFCSSECTDKANMYPFSRPILPHKTTSAANVFLIYLAVLN